jgi:1-phosphofructokinase
MRVARPRPGYGPPVSDAPPIAVFAPALVLLIELERDAEGSVDVHLHPGGQGYWVARMLRALGGRPIVCAPVGGEAGGVVTDLMNRDRADLRSVPMRGATASFVHDRRAGERVAVLETDPPPLGRHELDQLYSVTLGAALEAGVCVVAGTQAKAVIAADTYGRLVSDLVHTGVRVVADIAGEFLRAALAGHPDVLKVSHEELIADGWADGDKTKELARGVEALQAAGARDVVVSRAEQPALASIGGELVEVSVPQLEVVDHRGAGDSMTAGLAYCLARTGAVTDECLKLAAAAGALNVTRHGLASGHAETIVQLAHRVRITALDRDEHEADDREP